jgi:hypothetical protein
MRVPTQDVAKKLALPSADDAEYICAKAIRDGGIDATLDHAGGFLATRELTDLYATSEPQVRAPRARACACACALVCWARAVGCVETSETSETAPQHTVYRGVCTPPPPPKKTHTHTPRRAHASLVRTHARTQSAFHARIAFCLNLHNEAIKAMRYEPGAHTRALAAAGGRKEPTAEEIARERAAACRRVVRGGWLCGVWAVLARRQPAAHWCERGRAHSARVAARACVRAQVRLRRRRTTTCEARGAAAGSARAAAASHEHEAVLTAAAGSVVPARTWCTVVATCVASGAGVLIAEWQHAMWFPRPTTRPTHGGSGSGLLHQNAAQRGGTTPAGSGGSRATAQ